MADFDAVISTSVGGTGFSLDHYGKTLSGVWDQAGNRTGTQVQFVLAGDVFCNTPALLAVALAAIEAQCQALPADFWIKNGSTVRESISAGQCAEGPRLALKYVGEQGYRMQEVEITVDAVVGYTPGGEEDPDEGVLSSTYTTKVSSDAEGLRTETRTGTITTAAGTSAYDEALEQIPDDDADSQVTFDIESNQGDTRAAWSYTDRQIVSPYPASAAGDKIYDGEFTYSCALDAHNRQSMTYSYQYSGPGAAAWMNARRAGLAALGAIVRSRVSVTSHKTRTATGEFELIARAGGEHDILEFVETVTDGGTAPLLEIVHYPGTTPLVYAPSIPGYQYEQSGRAVGLQKYPNPAAYLFAAVGLAERPAISRTRNDANEWVTTWRYRFLFETPQGPMFPTAPSAAPGVYAGGA